MIHHLQMPLTPSTHDPQSKQEALLCDASLTAEKRGMMRHCTSEPGRGARQLPSFPIELCILATTSFIPDSISSVALRFGHAESRRHGDEQQKIFVCMHTLCPAAQIVRIHVWTNQAAASAAIFMWGPTPAAAHAAAMCSTQPARGKPEAGQHQREPAQRGGGSVEVRLRSRALDTAWHRHAQPMQYSV